MSVKTPAYKLPAYKKHTRRQHTSGQHTRSVQDTSIQVASAQEVYKCQHTSARVQAPEYTGKGQHTSTSSCIQDDTNVYLWGSIRDLEQNTFLCHCHHDCGGVLTFLTSTFGGAAQTFKFGRAFLSCMDMQGGLIVPR